MLVMEKLEGRSLRALLDEAGAIAPPRAAFIALQILSALAAAHEANIVHRDVKPANVFILSTFAVRDFVKVLDFGVAKVLEPDGAVPALTALGQVLGTASYMAPEQAKGLQVDGRADLFAVGGILFEALSGQRPRTLGPSGIIDAGTMPCLELRKVMPALDPRFAAVVDRALSLDRAARFPDAKAMAEALAPFAPGEIAASPALDVTKRSRGSGASTATTTTTTSASTSTTTGADTIRDPAPPPPAPPLRPHAYAPAPAPPRISQQSPASRPRSTSWSGLIYAVPVVIVVGILLLLVVGGFLLIGINARSRELSFLQRATPARCSAPATCSGTVEVHDDRFATCTPATANRYRRGDVVFVISGTYPHPATFVGPAAGGNLRITMTNGATQEVAERELRGPYCAP